ncbi:hypothetical protein BDQ12DRAFT_686799 [Crucibulum laeve]|uniref:Uncharacterized protein n=1 Tax=Crucibulum laeve TaxID=68775 RepID=A0A5C3M5I0_9AGAR|nr:hypothetical protein BDQ12DRAFT_686799 [Crucibulum laeve]
MNSPDGSPTSTPSSGSPPNEEMNFQLPSNATAASHFINLTSQLANTFSGNGSSKRRHPASSSFMSQSSRDPKSRRRGEPGRVGGGSNWEAGQAGQLKDAMGKREKDELIDHQLVDLLRKEIGDPFIESGYKG